MSHPIDDGLNISPSATKSVWRLKTKKEFISSLTEEEKQSKGGVAKLEQQQPTSRYFKCKKLADIIMLHGRSATAEDTETLGLFVHFLTGMSNFEFAAVHIILRFLHSWFTLHVFHISGILDPDPWKRWTAYQASNHPFITGSSSRRRPAGSDASISRQHISNGANGRPDFDIYWAVPWDPAICRRKLLCVQKARDKQQAMRRSNSYTGMQSSSLLSQQLGPQSMPRDGIQNLSTDPLRAFHQSEAPKQPFSS